MGYYVEDAVTGEPVYREGYSPDMGEGGTTIKHWGLGDHLKFASQNIDPRKSALPYALALPLLASAAAPAGASSVTGGGAGGGSTAIGSTGLSSLGLPGSSAASIGTGASVGGATGGKLAASSLIPKLLDYGGRAAGAYANATGNNRLLDNAADADYDAAERARAALELQRSTADLNQRRYQDDKYQTNARNSLYGGLLQGTQDINIQAPAGIPMGTVTGGLRPSGITGKDELGKELQRRAMEQLYSPEALPALPDIPASTPRRKTSGGEKAGGYISAAAPFITELLSGFRSSAPKPAAPLITAPASPYSEWSS